MKFHDYAIFRTMKDKWTQPKYAPLPRKACKDEEEALVHMCIWIDGGYGFCEN